jgi:hypothetical protein
MSLDLNEDREFFISDPSNTSTSAKTDNFSNLYENEEMSGTLTDMKLNAKSMSVEPFKEN